VPAWGSPGDSSFWQGAFREDDPDERRAFGATIGQRTISRFTLVPFGDVGDPSNWIVSVTRHWNLDRVDPR
jgi:hypothetical protein